MSPDWDGALSEFRNHLTEAGRRPGTCHTYLSHLRKLAGAFPDGPGSVTSAQLAEWVAEMSRPGRQNFAATAARVFYRWAVASGHLDVDPTLEACPQGLRGPGKALHVRDAPVVRVKPFSAAWLPLVEAYCRYIEAGGGRPGTVRQHRAHLSMFARHHLDPLMVTEEDCLAYLSNQAWAPETRKQARSSLRIFYAWMVRGGHLTVSPADDLPSVRVPITSPQPVPTDVLERALGRSDDRTRLMVLCGAYAGLRRAEIAAVHSRDITDGPGGVRVLRVVEGKGGSQRTVPLHPVLGAAIDAELERRRRGAPGSGWRYAAEATADGYLFPGMRSGEHVSAWNVGEVLGRVLGEHYTGHKLRHRFASRAYAVDRDIRAVQELLGHSKVETTVRYVAVPDGAKLAAVLGI